MSRLLRGKPCAEYITHKTLADLQEARSSGRRDDDSYIAIVQWGENKASQTYVRLKQRYGEKIGMEARIIGPTNKFPSIQQAHALLKSLNNDIYCKGIIVQLPLPDNLQKHQKQILSTIAPHKDIDGLAGQAQGCARVQKSDFMPATVRAVIQLCEFYHIPFKGTSYAVFGQSRLTGGSLVLALMQRQAIVFSFNEHLSQAHARQITHKVDVIVSCTGVPHLITNEYIRQDRSQYCIDVGFTKKDNRMYGDIDTQSMKGMIAGYTPIPGGVGPVTIACLFANVFTIRDLSISARMVHE